MTRFSPELVTTMRAVLEDAMAQVPVDQASTMLKAHVAECILTSAANGLTDHDGLLSISIERIPGIMSLLPD